LVQSILCAFTSHFGKKCNVRVRSVVLQLEDARQTISFELETLDIRPDPEPLLIEMIHAVSWTKFGASYKL